MIKNILFDLDGTLIDTDQEEFNKEYLNEVSNYFVSCGCNKELSIKYLWEAMLEVINNDGRINNEEVFSNYLENKLNLSKETLASIFTQFTDKEYNYLSKYIKKVEVATEAIKLLKQKNYNLILATNSLFPYNAIKKRAGWGDIDVELFSFVTTIENMNYAKPNINYYKQILSLNGLKADECMMFGNDLIEDLAVENLGIKCFIITDNMINANHFKDSKLNGNYEEFYTYIKENL